MGRLKVLCCKVFSPGPIILAFLLRFNSTVMIPISNGLGDLSVHLLATDDRLLYNVIAFQCISHFLITRYRIRHSCASQVPTISPISRFTVTGAHAHWAGSTDTPSYATKELKMR